MSDELALLPDLYESLDLDPDCDDDDPALAYAAMASADDHDGSWEHERALRLRELALRVLSDPVQRSEYDHLLQMPEDMDDSYLPRLAALEDVRIAPSELLFALFVSGVATAELEVTSDRPLRGEARATRPDLRVSPARFTGDARLRVTVSPDEMEHPPSSPEDAIIIATNRGVARVPVSIETLSPASGVRRTLPIPLFRSAGATARPVPNPAERMIFWRRQPAIMPWLQVGAIILGILIIVFVVRSVDSGLGKHGAQPTPTSQSALASPVPTASNALLYTAQTPLLIQPTPVAFSPSGLFMAVHITQPMTGTTQAGYLQIVDAKNGSDLFSYYAIAAAWAPRHDALAYLAPGFPSSALALKVDVFTPDGNVSPQRRLLAVNPSDAPNALAWSPSGMGIVYRGPSGLWLASETTGVPPREVLAETNGQVDLPIGFSGLNTLVAIVATKGATTAALVSVDISGALAQPTVWQPAIDPRYGFPTLSPDGSVVAAVVVSNGLDALDLVNTTTGMAITVANGATERDPAWSPGGRWLAYVNDAGGGARIVVQRYDSATRMLSGAPAPATPPNQMAIAPAWTPDGGAIAYLAAPSSGGAPTTWQTYLASLLLPSG